MSIAELKNFRLVKERVAVAPFLTEVEAGTAFWSLERGKIPVHRETRSIHLRAALRESGTAYYDLERSVATPAWERFPHLTAFLEAFAYEAHGALGRALIVGLNPGAQVYRHADRGRYFAPRDRYHLVLRSPVGTRFFCGGEEHLWREGEVWWFDNKQPHEVFNESGSVERIHVIFDLEPFASHERLLAAPFSIINRGNYLDALL